MKIVLSFVLFLYGGLSFCKTTDTLKVNGINDIQIISYLREYVDCSGRKNADQVLQHLESGDFKEMASARVVSRGVTACRHWFVLTVKNTSVYREKYLWSFYNDGIQFDLYQVDSTGTTLSGKQSLSHRTPYEDRQVSLRSISFLIPMYAGETKTFLLNTTLRGRQNLYFPTDFSTQSDILSYERDYSFLLGRYYGFFFFAFVFNLCFFLVLKKNFYIMMLGYIGSLLAFNTIEYLHDVYFIPSWLYGLWSRIPKQFFLAMTLFFNVYVFIAFVQHKKYFPRMSRMLSLLNRFVLVSSLIYLLIYSLVDVEPLQARTFQNIFVAILLLQVLYLLVNIVVSALRKTPYIGHYLIGNSLLFLSVILYLLNSFHLLYLPQIFLPGNIIFSFAVETIYLMIVFTVKYKRDFDRFAKEITAGERRRKRLAAGLISVQERERQRIAQDIHDGIGGSLQGLRLMLAGENLSAPDKIQKVLKEINRDFRDLLYRIAPRHLDQSGLWSAFRSDCISYSNVFLQIHGDDGLIPTDIQISLYRIYQELLTNALKHAPDATEINIFAEVNDSEVTLMVENNGCVEHNIIKGMGLQNVNLRAVYYGGTMAMDRSDHWHVVSVTIPLRSGEKTRYD